MTASNRTSSCDENRDCIYMRASDTEYMCRVCVQQRASLQVVLHVEVSDGGVEKTVQQRAELVRREGFQVTGGHGLEITLRLHGSGSESIPHDVQYTSA